MAPWRPSRQETSERDHARAQQTQVRVPALSISPMNQRKPTAFLLTLPHSPGDGPQLCSMGPEKGRRASAWILLPSSLPAFPTPIPTLSHTPIAL